MSTSKMRSLGHSYLYAWEIKASSSKSEVHHMRIWSSYFVTLLIILYVDSIMWNARLDEAQAGIEIARRNINNLRYADDTTLMAGSEEKLKSLFMKVKEESEKAGLKLNIQNTKIMASGPITSWQIEGLMLKLQYFCHLMWRADSLEKTLMLGKIEGRKRRGW